MNSSETYYIGHSGTGRKDEKGTLGLSDSKTYCMGGPGVIMSTATLAKVAPNINYCLKNLYTSHEDTELGRCINQFANVSCTKAKEVCISKNLTKFKILLVTFFPFEHISNYIIVIRNGS